MKKIGIIGSHGVGKTTLINKLHQELSILFNDRHVFLLPETPRKIVEELKNHDVLKKDNNTLFLQTILMLTQVIEETRFEGTDNDILICDRTIFDHWVYTKYFHHKILRKYEIDLIEGCLDKYCRSYNMILYLPIEFMEPKDPLRGVDSKFQVSIDNLLLNTISKYAYHRVTGTIENRVKPYVGTLAIID